MSLTSFVPDPKLEDYKEAFKEHFIIDRTDDGIVTVRVHTNGGALIMGVETHRAFGQVLRTIASDPENEVLIFTGTGPTFCLNADTESFKIEEEQPGFWSYEYAYKDGRQSLIALVQDMEIPTIGVINGSTAHSELLLMCDLTICSEEATIIDPHFVVGSVPGDGIHCAFQELLGVKRAAYALLTSQHISAQQALEWGMVNEVLPNDQLMGRANELAAQIMEQERVTRRMATQIVRRPWKKRLMEDLDGGFAMQMHAQLAKGGSLHTDEGVFEDTMGSIEGRRDGFTVDVD